MENSRFQLTTAKIQSMSSDLDSKFNALQSLYRSYLASAQAMERTNRELQTEIDKISGENIEPAIFQKVFEIAGDVEKNSDMILQIEKNYRIKNYTDALAMAKRAASVDEPNFLGELKKNYQEYLAAVSEYAKTGVDTELRTVASLARAVANVLYIKENANRLISKYVRESQVKDENIAQLNKRRREAERATASEQEEKKRTALEEVRKFQVYIDQYKAKIDSRVNILSEPKMQDKFVDSVYLPIGVATVGVERSQTFPEFDNATVVIPKSFACEVNLGKENCSMLIRYKDKDEDAADLYYVIESILIKFLQCYPATFKSVAAVDTKPGNDLNRIMGEIVPEKVRDKLCFTKPETDGLIGDSDDIKDLVKHLGNSLNERIRQFGRGNIFEYNMNNAENAQPLVLTVIKDYPNGFSDDDREKLKAIVKQGWRTGLYFLFVCKESVQDDVLGFCGNVFNFAASVADAPASEAKINALKGFDNLNQNYFRMLESELLSKQKSVSFRDVITGFKKTKSDFSESIQIPLAKEGGKIVSLELESNSGKAHAVTAGATGSGKSSLLNAIILNGAYLYSPDELELWLLDFKDGVGFAPFEPLKHVKMMSLKNKKKDATEIMNYLLSEMNSRNEKFKATRCRNIIDYNALQRKNKQKLMPRLLILIDEYTQMENMRESVNIMKIIAQQGRSAGMSLVIGSQERNSYFSEILAQISHRFEFKSNNANGLGLIESYNPEADGAFLGQLPGNCLYSGDAAGTNKHRMRIAYISEKDEIIDGKDAGSEMTRFIDEINQKYASVPYTKPVIMGTPDLTDVGDEVFEVDADQVKNNYRKNASIIVPFGRTRLGSELKYKVDKNNPLLFIFGDETRAAGIEYLLANRVAALGDEVKSVYYIDLVRSADRDDNAMFAMQEKGNENVFFARTQKEIMRAFAELNEIYQQRDAKQDEREDVGHPIEIIIHATEELVAQSEAMKKKRSAAPRIRIQKKEEEIAVDEEASEEDLLSQIDNLKKGEEEAAAASTEAGNVDVLETFHEIYRNGRDVRMYMVLHVENIVRFEQDTYTLFGNNYPDTKDSVVIPTRPSYDDSLSYHQIVECLRAAKQSEYGEFYSQDSGVERSEFEYAILFDERQPYKFIPYEKR